MRKPFIAGNWKMNNTRAAALELVNALKPLVADVNDVEIAVAPTFTCLQDVAEALKGSNIELSAQNISYAKSGAYTGEISADMLKDVGCTHAIIGHSERRQYFGETDKTVNLRVKAAVAAGLKVILCVGENKEEREAGYTDALVE